MPNTKASHFCLHSSGNSVWTKEHIITQKTYKILQIFSHFSNSSFTTVTGKTRKDEFYFHGTWDSTKGKHYNISSICTLHEQNKHWSWTPVHRVWPERKSACVCMRVRECRRDSQPYWIIFFGGGGGVFPSFELPLFDWIYKSRSCEHWFNGNIISLYTFCPVLIM